MKTQNQTMLSENTLTSRPTDIIAGFPVRPGFFELNGATPLSNGVNFTAHTRHGTSCELLLFHSEEEEPFAVLPFPNACRIGDVFDFLDIDFREDNIFHSVQLPDHMIVQNRYDEFA